MRTLLYFLIALTAAPAFATDGVDTLPRWPDGRNISTSCYSYPYWRQRCSEMWAASGEHPVWCNDQSVFHNFRDYYGYRDCHTTMTFDHPDYPQQWSDGWFYPAWCGSRTASWYGNCQEAWSASGENPVWCGDRSVFYSHSDYRVSRGSPDWCNVQPVDDIAAGAVIAARSIRKAAADPSALVFDLIYFMRDGTSEGEGLFCFMHHTTEATGREVRGTAAFRVAGKQMRPEDVQHCRGGSGLYLTKLVRAKEREERQ